MVHVKHSPSRKGLWAALFVAGSARGSAQKVDPSGTNDPPCELTVKRFRCRMCLGPGTDTCWSSPDGGRNLPQNVTSDSVDFALCLRVPMGVFAQASRSAVHI
jgi:hypothetical protein